MKKYLIILGITLLYLVVGFLITYYWYSTMRDLNGLLYCVLTMLTSIMAFMLSIVLAIPFIYIRGVNNGYWRY